jgi:hypothetical protein
MVNCVVRLTARSICASRKMVNYVVLPYTTAQWRKFGVVDVIQRQNIRGSFILLLQN